MERSSLPRFGPVAARFALLALLLTSVGLTAMGGAHATAYPELKANLSGPTLIGTSQAASYALTATGGPAVGFNGTQVGTLSFTSSVAGANTTNVLLTPSAGVLVNGSVSLSLTASNITETLVLSVEVTSHYLNSNATENLTYRVVVIQPYTLSASVVNQSNYGTAPFNLSVLLDGSPVGRIKVPGMLAGASTQVSYSYVSNSLSPGWHTFSVSLVEQHGLIRFGNGQTQYSVSFYVNGVSENDTLWYVTGVAAFVGAVFIWLTSVGARRRRRKR
ncbi:MAG: hypothetical protein L3J72_02940 [Thermoplasmata archaeon]|nr:hypothetical protein [Thermoplasmata archaeon]